MEKKGCDSINDIFIMMSFISIFSVVSCTYSSNMPAPIDFIGSKNSASNNLISNLQRTDTTISKNQPIITTSLTTLSKRKIQFSQTKRSLVVLKPLQTKNGHIVYNRVYTNIPKCSYTGGSTYIVQRGDTLFYIAWITGNNFFDLAHFNNIKAPYNLDIGQALQVLYTSQCTLYAPGSTIAVVDTSSKNATTSIQSVQQNNVTIANKSTTARPKNLSIQGVSKTLLNRNKFTTNSTVLTIPTAVKSIKFQNRDNVLFTKLQCNQWYWPTDGKIVENFSLKDGNKGIDIAGDRGQSIFAAASGLVVYAGNALRGYGNLIIIKHKNDYLSAYAHNDTVLVKERQEVKGRQRIATMGSTGTSSVRLHFEIRYKGNPVNPIRYLLH